MAQWTKTTITVNGQTYHSVEEMPPDVRQQYEKIMAMMADKNHNGVPDVLEGKPVGDGTAVTHVTTSVQSMVNGRTVPPGAVPPELAQFQPPEASADAIIYLRPWTLVALLGTAALVGAAIMWWVMR